MSGEPESVVEAARELLRRLSGPDVPAGIADDLRVLLARIPTNDSRFTDVEREAFAHGHGEINARGTHPARGESSPVAAAVRATELGLVVRFDVRHEGVPGYAHGSFVAGFFDVALGLIAIEEVGLGVTAELNVRLLRPTPLNKDVLYRGRVVRTEGRQTYVEGDAVVDGAPVASASIRFVHPRAASEGTTP
jgi:acyl-coenzyme A thioesterase PaaI-like protein